MNVIILLKEVIFLKSEKRLLMISLDAVSSDDLYVLSMLPNFSSLLKKGTLVRNVNSVFISNTYPCHTSIITGMLPNSHGITDNVYLLPKRKKQKWRFHSREIKEQTLYENAGHAGIKTCSILYPVTGGAKIDLNFPEIAERMGFFKKLFHMLRLGSTGYVLSSLIRFGKLLKGSSQPELDDFSTAVAADTIIRHKPGLMLLHLIDTDEHKHLYGPDSEKVLRSLERHDKRLGMLIDALKTAGTFEQTGIIIFSDHGCLPVKKVVDPNDFLESQGLIKRKNGALFMYDAYFHICGGTAFLKLYNEAKRDEIILLRDKILEEEFTSRLVTQKEMQQSGMDLDYMFGIQASDGFAFGSDYKGQHGYCLDREGYYPFYLAVGDTIESGKTLLGGCITDICPLAAYMLGLSEWNADGVNRLK